MNRKRTAVLAASAMMAIFVLVPSFATAGIIGGGGGGSNTYYSLSGSASVSTSTVTIGQTVTMKLVVSSYSNNPTADFQITSPTGNVGLYSVKIASDTTYSFTWKSDISGALVFRVAYVSEVSSTGSVTWSYINGGALTVDAQPTIYHVFSSQNPAYANTPITFTASVNWGYGSNPQGKWSVNGATGYWNSNNEFTFSYVGNYEVTYIASNSVGTTSYSIQEKIESPVSINIEVSWGDGGNVVLGGVTYSNGQQVSLLPNSNYSISPTYQLVGGGGSYWKSTFMNWATNAGHISNPNSPVTTFDPTSTGNLVLFLNFGLNESIAGMTQANGGNAGYSSMVTGTFQIPTTSYNIFQSQVSDTLKTDFSSYSTEETQYIYVAMGGATLQSLGGYGNKLTSSNQDNDLTALGGIYINYAGPYSMPTYGAFVAYGTQGNIQNYMIPVNLEVTAGQYITVAINAYSSSTYVTITDVSTSSANCTPFHLPVNQNYAEWQTQVGGLGGLLSYYYSSSYANVGPNFSAIKFTDVYTGWGNFTSLPPISEIYQGAALSLNSGYGQYQQMEIPNQADVNNQFSITESYNIV